MQLNHLCEEAPIRSLGTILSQSDALRRACLQEIQMENRKSALIKIDLAIYGIESKRLSGPDCPTIKQLKFAAHLVRSSVTDVGQNDFSSRKAVNGWINRILINEDNRN